MGPFLVSFAVWFPMTLVERCLLGDECLSWPLIKSVTASSAVMGLVCGLVALLLTEFVALWLEK